VRDDDADQPPVLVVEDVPGSAASGRRIHRMSERIIVGVDGSDGARVALEWAVGEARLRGARLVAVHTWQMPPVGAGAADPFGTGAAAFNPSLDADLMERVEAGAKQLLEREIAAVDTSSIEVERLVEARSAADALLDAARGADLLVVGTRGHGGFKGLLLGSVSQQASHHAPCPVVIVPPPDKD
jgi:nucleotide-binding universal stress UspA family protein